jgi:hypothetical protein
MPIKTIKTDLEWGDIFFIKIDPFQYEHSLVGLIHLPNGQLQFQLRGVDGDIMTVYDFECSKEPDKLKRIKNDENEGDIER